MTTPDLAQTVRDIAAYLESWTEIQRDRARVPGVQVAVRVKGELVASYALGVVSADTGEPLTTGHLFHVASHSKTFTAVSVMQLVERSLVRLDDVVATWVPELADAPIGEVSVRDLLSHLGGVLRDGEDADYWQLGADFPDREGLLAMARGDLVLPTNQHFKYTNVGYSVLGLVVEAASGQPYEAYVTEHIIEPLGLVNTGPEATPEREPEFAACHLARVFGDDVMRVVPPTYSRAMAAATGFYSTAEDITAYLSCLAPGRTELLSDASKRLMQRKAATVARGGPRHYGLGLLMREVDGATYVGHSGGWPGHITQTWLDPERELCVSVLTSCLGGPASEWAAALIRLVNVALAAAETEPVADARRFAGRYAGAWGIEDIAVLGGQLHSVDPTSTDIETAVTRLERVDEHTLTAPVEDSFGAGGEAYHVSYDEKGQVTRVRQGGASLWPLARWLELREEFPTSIRA